VTRLPVAANSSAISRPSCADTESYGQRSRSTCQNQPGYARHQGAIASARAIATRACARPSPVRVTAYAPMNSNDAARNDAKAVAASASNPPIPSVILWLTAAMPSALMRAAMGRVIGPS
jgi:hypothetical protein